MTPLKINPATIVFFMTVLAVTSCSKESLVEDVAPQSTYSSHEYDAVVGSSLHITTIAATTVNRMEVEGYIYEGGGEISEDTDPPTVHTLWVYSIGGHDTLSIDKVGSVSLDFSISTNPYSRNSKGELVIQSLDDRHSVMRYQIAGSDKISEMSSQRGYEMELTLISAQGGFTQAAREGVATLSSSGNETDAQQFSRMDIYLNNE